MRINHFSYLGQWNNYIKDQNNNIINIGILKKILNEEDLIYISDKNIKNYAFSSSLINISFSSLITSSLKYNNYNYNGIKINSTKNIISLEDDIELYTISTNEENILIYICPYNNKIKEIIKKYDKNNNIFNGFTSFVNLMSLYLEDNVGDNEGKEKMIWIPCFEIDSQLICSKMPGYKKIQIKNNSNNKDMNISEYDEIIKINMKPIYDNKNTITEINKNIEINQKDDIIIENDFIFGLYHKELNTKFNNPFISLVYIGKDNFMKIN